MPRRKRSRLILTPPTIKGFNVTGTAKKSSEKVSLFLEEYETIKLLDYENLTQEQAAVRMQISRPTLTRVYESARNKVAKAFTEGRDLIVQGGDFHFDDTWHRCSICRSTFELKEGEPKVCPICNSDEVRPLNDYYSSL